MKILKKTLIVCAATLVLLIFIEGAMSLGLFIFDLSTSSESPLAERQHTTYDEELGWASLHDTEVLNIYGEGRHIHLDSSGFRVVPTGVEGPFSKGPRKTIVCSGDSFTFGFGVGDGETWVHQLNELEDHWHTVNMGQGGYGLDQAYLWYRREAGNIPHDFHIFAVIHDDFRRMQYGSFLGYGKPTLVLEGGVPVAANVPVPKNSFRWPWWTQNRRLLRTLRFMQVFSRTEITHTASADLSVEDVRESALAAMKDLESRHKEAGRGFVFLWLPTRDDVKLVPARDSMRRSFLGALRQDGIIAIDLVDKVRGLDESEIEAWFIAPGEMVYRGAEGHYTPYGNRKIAEAVHQQLLSISSLSKHLAR